MIKDKFIELARNAHGDKYDYSLVPEIVKANSIIEIICPKHGVYEQNARMHYRGHGCPKCYRERQSERMRMTTEQFIKRARDVNGDIDDYSKTIYVDNETPVTITCPIHGDYQQTPHEHLRGKRCPKCSRMAAAEKRRVTQEVFIERVKKAGLWNEYIFTDAHYVANDVPVKVICRKHGAFMMSPVHLWEGRGCPKCSHEKKAQEQAMGLEEFVRREREKFGDKFDLSKVVYVNEHTKITLGCPIHGEIQMTPQSHLGSKTGCVYCGRESTGESIADDDETFKEKCRKKWGDTYILDDIHYTRSKDIIYPICRKHGPFAINGNNFLQGHGCPKCMNPHPQWEQEINDYVVSIGIDDATPDRSVLGRQEIDIFSPKYMIGFECDGLRWHCELYRDKNYHLAKTEECLNQGIQLYHIFEDEWKYKQEICKSVIASKFHKFDERIFARKCMVAEVSSEEANAFLDANHLQGKVYGSIRLGLYYQDRLVSLMTFGKRRKNLNGHSEEGEYELLRFATILHTMVVGGAERLFKHFIDAYKPKKIISYCDRRWFTGELYSRLGFVHDHDSCPNYFYVVESRRKNRFNYRKDVLVSQGYDKTKTEHEIMKERKIYRIYDCGTMVFVWNNNLAQTLYL